jgi:cell division transport system permease protein
MNRNRTGYYIKEGFNSVFTHGLMSFASVCIIVACLIIMGSFSLLAININSIIGDFANENVMLAYVSDTLTEPQARGLQPQITAVRNVNYVTFTSREDAMRNFIGKYGDQERFKGIDASVFRHRFVVYVDDIEFMEQTQTDLRSIAGIDTVSANLIVARGFVTLRNIVSAISVVLIVVLFVISLFIMSNTVKLTTFERREEIAIMRMVGATSGFIRWPFVFEGFILGLLGALFAYVAQWGVYTLITDKIVHNGSISFMTMLPFSRAAFPLFAVFVVVGLGVGVIGSSIAIRKYLKV